MPMTPAFRGLGRNIAGSLRPAWLYNELEAILGYIAKRPLPPSPY